MKSIVNFIAALTCTIASTVSASPTTYQVNGVFQDHASLGGFFVADPTTGVVSSVNFLVGPPDSETFSVLGYGYQHASTLVLIDAVLEDSASAEQRPHRPVVCGDARPPQPLRHYLQCLGRAGPGLW